ncbi:MAG: nucleotidyltransferase domain-containing protein [bacterium]
MILNNIANKLHLVFEKYKDYIKFAYLFGSAARDDLTPLSDIDVAVFLCKEEKELYFNLKFDIHADICRILKRQ